MYCIDINDVYGYMICPFKFNFSHKEEKELDCFQNVKAYIYSELFDYVMYRISTDQIVTVPEVNKKLNYIWNDIQPSLKYKTNIAEKLSIKYRLVSIVNLFSNVSTVVYYKLPRTIKVSDTEILYNLYTYIDLGVNKSVVKLNNIHIGLNEYSSNVQLLLNIIAKDIKRVIDSSVSIFRCDTAEIYRLTEERSSKNIIENIVKGIENEIQIPKNDFVTCSTCSYRTQCSWSSKKE